MAGALPFRGALQDPGRPVTTAPVRGCRRPLRTPEEALRFEHPPRHSYLRRGAARPLSRPPSARPEWPSGPEPGRVPDREPALLIVAGPLPPHVAPGHAPALAAWRPAGFGTAVRRRILAWPHPPLPVGCYLRLAARKD